MLNSEQKKAIEIIDKPLIVIAGPGTGKTTLITHKINYLLKKNISQENILALTFTEKAAKDMSERIFQKTNINFSAKTFHSFALELIEEYYFKIPQIDKNYNLIDEANQLIFFLENLSKFNLSSIELKNNTYQIASSLHSSISKLKEYNIKPIDLEKLKIDDLQVKMDLLSVYSRYEKYKQENNFVDFADLLILVIDLIKNNPQIKKELQNRFNYILIDEFQDTNPIQLDLIKLISTDKITIVGDQKQSIYGFRGANINNLKEFKDYFKSFEEIYLHENYRSSKEIINLINNFTSLIASDKELLISNSKKEGKVKLIKTKDENSQNTFILEKIRQIQITSPNSSIGILCRRQSEVKEISKFLNSFNIKHFSSSSNLFEKKIINDFFLLLEIIDDPKSANSQIFHLLKHSGLRHETVKKISRKSSIHEKSLFITLDENNLSEYQGEEEIISQIKIKLEEIIKLKESNSSLISLIKKTLDLFNFYQKAILSKDEDNIKALNLLQKFTLNFQNLYSTDLSYFIKVSKISHNLEFSEETHQNHLIEVMTIHQSKGKEYDSVFIPNLNERKFPSNFKKSNFQLPIDMSKQDFLSEEEKLFFVAISRAKNNNYLTYVKKFSSNKLDSKPSPFVEKLKLKTENYDKIIHFSNNKKEEIKLEIIEKIQSLLLENKFDLAQKEINLLKSLFEKNNLNSFIQEKHPDLKIYEEKLKGSNLDVDIDTSQFIYSVSQLQTYEICPQKYLYQYIYKIPSSNKHYFDFGTSIHSVLEEISVLISKNSDKSIIYTKAMNLLNKCWISKGYENTKQEKEYFHKGIKVIRDFIDFQIELSKEDRKIIAREEKFLMEINGKKIMGFIDRIDKINNHYEILDYKTSNSMELKSKLPLNMQLGVYALALKNMGKFNSYPKSMGLWYLIHNKISKVDFNEENLIKIKEKILDLINQIEKKNFTATPSVFGCKFCDFNNICSSKK